MMLPREKFPVKGHHVYHRIYLLFVLVCSAFIPAIAKDYTATANHIVVRDPFVHATVHKEKVHTGYLILENHSDTSDRLMVVRSDIANHIEIHETRVENNTIKMRKVADGLEVGAHDTVTLRPGGYHLMFFDLHKALDDGESFEACLEFEKSGKINAVFDVKSVGTWKNPMQTY